MGFCRTTPAPVLTPLPLRVAPIHRQDFPPSMTALHTPVQTTTDDDHAALRAACQDGASLCTIVGIHGSFSRRLGAQLAVLPDGRTIGSLSDGCLERQLSDTVRSIDQPELHRFGAGSTKIDFRLPCGGGLDILLDPAPDKGACEKALATIAERRPSRLELPSVSPMRSRSYVPQLHLRAFGEGPELSWLEALADSMKIRTTCLSKSELTLGLPSRLPSADAFTAIVFLFHDHEWELALIEEALRGEAFYIGAQGGDEASQNRTLDLLARGLAEHELARLRSPIGALRSCRTPRALALSVLTEIVGEYEHLVDAG